MRKLTRLTQADEDLFSIRNIKDHLRVDFDADDNALEDLYLSSINILQGILRIPIAKADYSIVCDLTPTNVYDYARVRPVFEFGKTYVDSIDSIKVYDKVGAEIILVEYTDYAYNPNLNIIYFPTKLNIKDYNRETLIITFNAGWTTSTVPAEIKTSLLNIIAHLYENRGTNLDIPREALQPSAEYKFWI